MPLLSEFFGIKITIYFDDHMPPHFHAEYVGQQILVDIASNCVIRGSMQANKLKLVLGWADLHHAELEAAWEDVCKNKLPKKINPLK